VFAEAGVLGLNLPGNDLLVIPVRIGAVLR
jgi:hypothetical protein